jgi:GT2 family glycosyltransferase
MNPLVSIIILNYNGADLLPDCLNSLLRVKYSPLEIIVVENGSRDNSAEVLAGFPTIKTVNTSVNLGSSGGYNLGLEHSQGEFILMMNNDMIANPEFVSVLSSYLVDNPKVGIVQGKMILPRYDNRLEVCGSFLTRFGLPYHYGYYKKDGPKYEKNYPVFTAKGACMMFRRQVIADAGGYYFNPDFFCYYEETDLCHRAWLAGYETHFVASPPIEHLAGVTIAREEKAGFGLHYYLRNMMFSLLTTLAPSSLIKILPLYLTMFFASMILAALTGRTVTAKAHWKALVYNLVNYKKIALQRKRVRAFRKVSDREIFPKLLRTPRIEYFLKTFRGKLDSYID